MSYRRSRWLLARNAVGTLVTRAALLFAVLLVGPVPWLGQTPLLGQVPSESELPGSSNPPGAFSPSEQVLPNTDPIAQIPDQNASEAVLPTGTGAAPARGDSGSDEDRGELRPILRLAFDGHTGPIRAVTIGGDGQWMASAGGGQPGTYTSTGII